MHAIDLGKRGKVFDGIEIEVEEEIVIRLKARNLGWID